MYISLKSHELLIILSSPWVLNTVKAKIKNSQNSKFAKKMKIHHEDNLSHLGERGQSPFGKASKKYFFKVYKIANAASKSFGISTPNTDEHATCGVISSWYLQ